MLYKKICPILITLMSVSCSNAPFSYTYEGFDYASKDNVIAEINKVMSISNKGERFRQTIELDKKMVEEGVFLPSIMYKGRLQKSRFYNLNDKANIADYKHLIICNEYITNKDRDEIRKISNKNRDEIKAYFINKGYSIKNYFQTKESYYFDHGSTLFDKILPTNNRGLFKIVNNEISYDLIDTINIANQIVTISIKDAYWKDYKLDNIRQINSDDFIYTYNLIKKNIKDSYYYYNDNMYDQDTFSHITDMKKIDDKTFSIAFDKDIDIGYNINIFPINKEMVDKWSLSHEETLNYQDFVFADGEYTIDYTNHTYLLKTKNNNYLNEIRFVLNDKEESSFSYQYDNENDIVDILDLSEDADYQYDDYTFGRNKIRIMYSLHLISGDKTTPVYNEAIKSTNFRKALLIFLYNNLDIVINDYFAVSKANQISQATERFVYYDYVLDGVSYKEEINKTTKIPLTISDAKNYFELFKNEFDVNFNRYPIELNFMPSNNEDSFIELEKRFADVFDNNFKLVKKSWSDWPSIYKRLPEKMFYNVDYLDFTKPIYNDPADYLNKIITDMYNPYQ